MNRGVALTALVLVSGIHCGTSAARQTAPAKPPGTVPPYQARFAPRTRGSGPVTVYELFDFQCPFCRDFALHTFPAVDSLYVRTGKVRWVVINNPIERHANAVRAAEVMICAGRAGKFWELSDRILAQQAEWGEQQRPDSIFFALASSVGLDTAKLSRCVQSGAGRAEVRADAAFLSAIGFPHEGVPTFVVGGRKVAQGALPFTTFRRVLDSLIAAGSRPTS